MWLSLQSDIAPTITILSGGQTGADRAALDAAIDLGVPCGGWCPDDRSAEDGEIPEHYPLQPLPGGDKAARTDRNVQDSDGTLIVSFGQLQGGTLLTRQCCERHNTPRLIVDADAVTVEQAGEALAQFVEAYSIDRLNVAGPRASEAPQIYDYVYRLMQNLFSRLEREQQR